MSHRYFEEKSHTVAYSKYRSIPPKQLIDQIIIFLKDKYSGSLDIAVDVGCGSGQSTGVFAPHFNRVIGTDISAAMIDTANESNRLGNVSYRVSAAEEIPTESGSVQLLSSCEAAHWFDLPKFFEQGRRILCTNGVLSLIAYDLPQILSCDGHESLNSRLTEVLEKVFKVDLREFLPAEIELVHRKYTDIVFPDFYKDFQRIDTYYDEQETNVRELSMFCTTWSPYQKYCTKFGEEKGAELLKRVEDKFMEILDAQTKPEDTVLIKRTNYFVLMARNT